MGSEKADAWKWKRLTLGEVVSSANAGHVPASIHGRVDPNAGQTRSA